MKYEVLAKMYAELEGTSSTLSKIDLIANFLRKVPKPLLKRITYLLKGEIFPPWLQKELNMAEKMAMTAISRTSGANRDEVLNLLKKKGDLGSSAAALLVLRKQSVLFKEELTVNKVYNSLKKISQATGEGSVDKKISLLAELLSNAEPEGVKYIIRTVLGQLRIGVGEGVIREALAKAFQVSPELVEKANAVLNDFGEVAELALKGEKALEKVKLNIGRPLKAMLYPKTENMEEGLEKTGLPVQIEYKYDGFRTQIHKKGKEVKIFTRRLDDVTHQFPDVVKAVRKGVNVKNVVIDSETVGINPKTGKWVPFQKISRRIRRKYEVEKMAKEIPVITYLFDLLYLDNLTLIDLTQGERFEMLRKTFTPSNELKLVDFLKTKNKKEAEAFYTKALAIKTEGVMLKNISSPYKPGQRVGYGYKLKPETETLDLVIVGAEWGEGKRAKWLSSFIVAAKQGDNFVEIGKVATGTTEADLEILTESLKPLFLKEKGTFVTIKPKIIIEVGFQEIQKSSKYNSGFALRFPRMIRIRNDKSIDELNTLARIRFLFESQFKFS